MLYRLILLLPATAVLAAAAQQQAQQVLVAVVTVAAVAAVAVLQLAVLRQRAVKVAMDLYLLWSTFNGYLRSYKSIQHCY